ncbi:hypothetical protein AcW1_000432 [Taiwanofungus camphoratus]|nr:hypothetical protein AcW1_000432 [Antrodia cinnamomea]
MSSDQGVFIGDSVALQEFVYNTCTLAASALIFYEHLITLQKEVQQFWGRNISGGLIVFLLDYCNKVLLKFYQVLNCDHIVIWCDSSVLSSSCICYQWPSETLMALIFGLVPVGTNLYISFDVSYASAFIVNNYGICNYSNHWSISVYNKCIVFLLVELNVGFNH